MYIDSLYYFLHFHLIDFWPDQVAFSCFTKLLRGAVQSVSYLSDLCIYVFMCVHMCIWVLKHVCVETRGWHWMLSSINLHQVIFTLFFETVFKWTWCLLMHIDWLVCKSEELPCLFLPGPGLQACVSVPGFHTWVMGGHTQILMIEWQTFFLLN